jgi:hypothetical protein
VSHRASGAGMILCAPLLLAACSGCDDGGASTGAGATSSVGGAGAGSGEVTSVTIGPGPVTSSTASSSGTCYGTLPEDPDRPELIPEGWLPWTCWGAPRPDCTLWFPPDPGEVEPATWIPCDEGLPAGLDCEQMAITWAETDDDEVGARPFLSLLDGVPMLGLERRRYVAGGSDTSWIEYVAMEADGPVRAAGRKLAPREPGCGSPLTGAFGARLVVNMLLVANEDDGAVMLDASGWFLGARHPEAGLNDWHLSASQVIQQTYTQLIRHDIAFQNPEIAFDASEVGLGVTSPIVSVGDDILFTAGDYGQVAVFGWRQGTGLVTIERFPGDYTQGAMGIGGDGEHLVWTRGEGRDDVDPPPIYPEHSVMVSPYTFDRTQLEPRRLRADSNGGLGDPWRVGCGHASRRSLAAPSQVQIVRLEDGAAWMLDPTVSDTWAWVRPVGITCDHVYVEAKVRGIERMHGTIARVRIDSLGEGLPPD